MPQPPTPRTLSALIAAFTSFLTVSIHTILHQRSLYPQSSFLTARAYNYPVRQSRHPAVCAWITDAVVAVEAELLRNSVARVALVIYSAGIKPLERYIWDVSRFPVVARPQDQETMFASSSATAARDGSGGGDAKTAAADRGEENVDLEEQFRAALAKLTVCGDVLAPLPPGCTFTVAVEMKDEVDVDPPVGHPQPWIPVQPDLQAVRRSRVGEDENELGRELGGAKTTPVRSVRAGEMIFEMWIEEGKAKVDMMESSGSNASSVDYR